MNKPLINKMTPVYIIAEAGVNHNGDIELAKRLIDVAAQAGADAVKFQTFKAENIISKAAPKAEYQKNATSGAESQLEMVKKLELDEDAHHTLIAYCRLRKIEFLSTPFDFESIDLLSKTLNLPRLKIPSGEITNGPYLLAIAKTKKPLILSTGMSNIEEVETALDVLAFSYCSDDEKPSLKKLQAARCSSAGRKALKKKVTLLHCTTDYPASFKEVNLNAMATLHKTFRLPVGLSDHTPGIAVPIAAVALGAAIVEKHFTLDKKLPGPDHKASLDPDELTQMVVAVRQIEAALGRGEKIAMPGELKNRDVVRKSLVALRQIRRGEVFTSENLTLKRPGSGISHMRYWEMFGKKARKDYNMDEII